MPSPCNLRKLSFRLQLGSLPNLHLHHAAQFLGHLDTVQAKHAVVDHQGVGWPYTHSARFAGSFSMFSIRRSSRLSTKTPNTSFQPTAYGSG